VSGEADYTWLHGYQRVWADGHAVSMDIMSGGQQVVDGSALYSFIEGGGHMLVDAGGVGNQTSIETGGIERVLAGGIELEAIFVGAGTLDLASANCVGLIDGWQAGAKIDLRDIGFDANSSLNYDAKAGILTISNGQQSEHLHFVSPTGIFNASSDGHGGTLISSPVGQA